MAHGSRIGLLRLGAQVHVHTTASMYPCSVAKQRLFRSSEQTPSFFQKTLWQYCALPLLFYIDSLGVKCQPQLNLSCSHLCPVCRGNCLFPLALATFLCQHYDYVFSERSHLLRMAGSLPRGQAFSSQSTGLRVPETAQVSRTTSCPEHCLTHPGWEQRS